MKKYLYNTSDEILENIKKLDIYNVNVCNPRAFNYDVAKQIFYHNYNLISHIPHKFQKNYMLEIFKIMDINNSNKNLRILDNNKLEDISTVVYIIIDCYNGKFNSKQYNHTYKHMTIINLFTSRLFYRYINIDLIIKIIPYLNESEIYKMIKFYNRID